MKSRTMFIGLAEWEELRGMLLNLFEFYALQKKKLSLCLTMVTEIICVLKWKCLTTSTVDEWLEKVLYSVAIAKVIVLVGQR